MSQPDPLIVMTDWLMGCSIRDVMQMRRKWLWNWHYLNKTSTRAKQTSFQNKLYFWQRLNNKIFYLIVKTFLIQMLIRKYNLLNILKRMSVNTYRLIASACKTKCFWIWKQKKVEKIINTLKDWIGDPLMLQLQGAIYRPDSFVLMLRYCANLKAIRYESTTDFE